jgi:hypothetical protein
MNPSLRKLISLIGVAVALLLLLAACASPQAAPGATDDSPDNTATAIDLCSLVTPDEVTGTLGQSFQPVATTNVHDNIAYAKCSFGDNKTGSALELEMTLGQPASSDFKAGLDNAKQAQGALPFKETSGSNYQAYSVGSAGQLIQTSLLKGDVEIVFVVFQNGGTFDTDKALALAQSIASRLP